MEPIKQIELSGDYIERADLIEGGPECGCVYMECCDECANDV